MFSIINEIQNKVIIEKSKFINYNRVEEYCTPKKQGGFYDTKRTL